MEERKRQIENSKHVCFYLFWKKRRKEEEEFHLWHSGCNCWAPFGVCWPHFVACWNSGRDRRISRRLSGPLCPPFAGSTKNRKKKLLSKDKLQQREKDKKRLLFFWSRLVGPAYPPIIQRRRRRSRALRWKAIKDKDCASGHKRLFGSSSTTRKERNSLRLVSLFFLRRLLEEEK